MSDNKFGVQLDFETADRILVCALKEHYNYLKKEVDETDVLTVGPNLLDDYTYNLRLLKAMEIVVSYFGEKL